MTDFFTAQRRLVLGPGTGLRSASATVTFPADIFSATCHLLAFRWSYSDSDHRIRLVEVTSQVTGVSGNRATVAVSATLQDQNGDDRFDAMVEVMVVARSMARLSYPQAFQQQARVQRASAVAVESATSTDRLPFTISPAFAGIDQFVFGMEGFSLVKYHFLRDQFIRRMGTAIAADRTPRELRTTATLWASDNSPSDDRWVQDITVSAVGADNRLGEERGAASPSLLFTEQAVSWNVPRGSVTLGSGADPHRGVTLTYFTATPIFAPMLRSIRIESTDGDHNLMGIGVRARHVASRGPRTMNVEAQFFDADGAEGFNATVGVTIYHTRPLSIFL